MGIFIYFAYFSYKFCPLFFSLRTVIFSYILCLEIRIFALILVFQYLAGGKVVSAVLGTE